MFSYLLVCVQMFICAYVRNGCHSGICCCGVGAPLGLSVLLCCFPAAQRFTGPPGDTGGRGHMTGPCEAELVTPTVPQQAHPFGILLSVRCHPTPQRSSRSAIEPDVPCLFHFILKRVTGRAGARVATRAKWTFLCSFLSRTLCWQNCLPRAMFGSLF